MMENVTVIHAGTVIKYGQPGVTLTNGGRVLGVLVVKDTREEARQQVYKAVELISWKGEFHRNDIGLLGY